MDAGRSVLADGDLARRHRACVWVWLDGRAGLGAGGCGASVRVEAIARPERAVAALLGSTAPDGVVSIVVGRLVALNIVGGGEVLGVAPDVFRLRILVHAHPVHLHHGGEAQPAPVGRAKVLADAEVEDDVHRLLGNRSVADLRHRVRLERRRMHLPGPFAVRDPVDVSSRSRLVLEAIRRKGLVSTQLHCTLRRERDATKRLLVVLSIVQVEVRCRLEELVCRACRVGHVVKHIERGRLHRLGDGEAELTVNLGLEDVDLGGTASAQAAVLEDGTGMILAGAGACRESLAWEEGKRLGLGFAIPHDVSTDGGGCGLAVGVGLVHQGADVACAVRIGPGSVGGGTVSGASEVAHGPEGGPETWDGAIGCGDSLGRIPLVVVCCPVVQVGGLPKRIVARIEGASVGVEFVGKDELHGGSQAGYAGNLARGVDSAEIEATFCALVMPIEVGDDGVSAEEGDECEGEDDEHANVEQASGTECASEAAVGSVVRGARVMQGIVRLFFAIHGVPRVRIGEEVVGL
ncbi:hypothetical protein L1887_50715 [Cichorium endivia]|nr:hypothetical protein L1887_50715 [Cichorium endivia]